MSGTGRIDLAHEAPFRLGALEVRPGLRQLVRDDGVEEILEPRVMQVLVALARAGGAILSRDDLTTRCWEGRVVGEDAINRVISRLRRSAEGIGRDAFRIETVTKVGYRLVSGEPASAPTGQTVVRGLRLDRRAMLAGGGAAVAGAAGLWGWRRFAATPQPSQVPAEVAEMMKSAINAIGQGTPEGTSQATGLLKRVVQIRPDFADGWGLLALSYASASRGGAPASEAAMRVRTNEAADRALQLDPDNANAQGARLLLEPMRDNWLTLEKGWRAIYARQPHQYVGVSGLSGLLYSVGRFREAAQALAEAWKIGPHNPSLASSRALLLWATGRLEEADGALRDATELYPTHFAIWFRRFYLLLYTGRAREALAMGQNTETRPSGIPAWNFELTNQIAEAMISRAPADIDKALAANVAASRRGSGFAENTIQFAAALGRIDTAFQVADAYFFGRGFETGDLDFSPEQRSYTRRNARRTGMLFLPSATPMRGDPRFEKLVEEIGLTRYWRESGTLPDYRNV